MNITAGTCSSDPTFATYKIIVDVYLVTLLSMFGISGNLLSVVVLGKDRSVRSTTGYLLQMLALSDAIYLTTCLLYQTLNTLEDCTDWVIGLRDVWPYMELFIWPAASIAQTSAVWLVVVVTADRYIAICRPLHAPQYSTLSRIRRAVIAVWVFSILYNLPRVFERVVIHKWDEVTNSTITVVEKTSLRENNLYVIIYKMCLFFIVRFFLPLSSLAFFNTRLIQAIKESGRLQQERPRETHRKEKYTLTLVVVVIVFVVCELPDFVLRFWMALHMHAPSFTDVLPTLRYINVISNLFLTINSCVNFVIYCFMGQKFRRILLRLICPRSHNQQHTATTVRMSVRWDRGEEVTTLVRSS